MRGGGGRSQAALDPDAVPAEVLHPRHAVLQELRSLERKIRSRTHAYQGQKLVLVNEIPAKSASSSLGLPSEEGERWALGDLYQPCCSLSADLTERKHKRVERGGSLGYGKLQIFKFKIWNVFTNSKCSER